MKGIRSRACGEFPGPGLSHRECNIPRLSERREKEEDVMAEAPVCVSARSKHTTLLQNPASPDRLIHEHTSYPVRRVRAIGIM